jgi:RNA polymerase sigma factor (sigma-70 family)
MKSISDEEFNLAYEDENHQKIINAASRHFRGKLPYDELKQRGRIALMRCLGSHDPSSRRQFTTSLTQFVKWECYRALRDHITFNRKTPLSFSEIAEPSSHTHPRQSELDHLKECLEKLSLSDRDILYKYYVSNMTLKEIGQAYSYTGEAARQNLQKATNRLRSMCQAE